MAPPDPQQTPSLVKKALGWTLLGVFGIALVVPMFKETMTARRLDALAERVLALEAIYDAEELTAAYRSRPDDQTQAPSEGE